MNKLTIRILSAIISAVFVISIGFLCISISSDSKKGTAVAQRNFEAISLYTKNLCTFYKPDTKDFLDGFKTRLSQEKEYYKIVLVYNENEIFSHFISDAKSSFSSKEFSSVLYKENENNLVLKAYYTTVDNQNIFNAAKTSFFMILAGTVLALALLAVQTLILKKEDEIDGDMQVSAIDFESENDTLKTNENNLEKAFENTFDKVENMEMLCDAEENSDYYENKNLSVEKTFEEPKANSQDIIELSDEEISEFSDFDDEEEIEEIEGVENSVEDEILEKYNNIENNSQIKTQENNNFEKTASTNVSDNESFDENSKTSDEKNLENDLNEKLADAAALNHELSIVMIQSKDYASGKPLFDSIKNSISDQKVYDYKNGFIVILEKTDLDTAYDMGEQLHLAIKDKFKESGFVLSLSTGVASRAERIITGTRLLTEAEQACEHGFEDEENSVVAFRVDPEKYRQYIMENQ